MTTQQAMINRIFREQAAMLSDEEIEAVVRTIKATAIGLQNRATEFGAHAQKADDIGDLVMARIDRYGEKLNNAEAALLVSAYRKLRAKQNALPEPDAEGV